MNVPVPPVAASTGRRVAVITGSTDGIGRATAQRLARDGWEVAIVGRNAEKVARTVGEVQGAGGHARGFVADLSLLADVRRLADELVAAFPLVHALVLNANTVTTGRVRTPEGFEANFAIGHLGRALLARRLAPRLGATPGSQVLGVVGLNLTRLDPDDLPLDRGAPRTALGRWQWTHQVWLRAWNARALPSANAYMPGLVRTKILADEPQPMRALVKVANALFGVPVEQGGDELAEVVRSLADEGRRDVYFARTQPKGRRSLGDKPGDEALVWDLTERLLAPWLGG